MFKLTVRYPSTERWGLIILRYYHRRGPNPLLSLVSRGKVGLLDYFEAWYDTEGCIAGTRCSLGTVRVLYS